VHAAASWGRGVIRVLLADDQALLRGAFKVLLLSDPDMDVVGEAADGEEAITRVRALRPDVVLMDIRCRAWTDLKQHAPLPEIQTLHRRACSS
jgi:DNA-binding NarL/FixJ family response regulator